MHYGIVTVIFSLMSSNMCWYICVFVCTGKQRSDRHQTVPAGAQCQEQGQMEFRDSDHEEVNILYIMSWVNFLFLPPHYGSHTGLLLTSKGIYIEVWSASEREEHVHEKHKLFLVHKQCQWNLWWLKNENNKGNDSFTVILLTTTPIVFGWYVGFHIIADASLKRKLLFSWYFSIFCPLNLSYVYHLLVH